MKEEFLNNLRQTIKQNPNWAADALLAVNYGLTEFEQVAQEKYNTAEVLYKFIRQSKPIQKLLDKHNIKF